MRKLSVEEFETLSAEELRTYIKIFDYTSTTSILKY